MKRLCLLSAILISFKMMGQHDIVPQPVPAIYISDAQLSAGSNQILHVGDIIAPPPSGGTAVIPAQSVTEFVSNHRIFLQSGFRSEPSGNGVFHAMITPQAQPLAIFTPANQPPDGEVQVEQNDKLEFGLTLPQAVTDAIEAFKFTTNAAVKVNPFNPEQLKLNVTYRHYVFTTNMNTWNDEYAGMGFYYEEYHRDLSDNDPENWHGVKDTTSYPVRFRFAPPVRGLWKAMITVECPVVNYAHYYEFWFYCNTPTDPENKGFVYRNPGDHYFSLGNGTFMPFGNNIQWPGQGTVYETGYKLVPSGYYLEFFHRMTELAQSGADFFRMNLSPISTDIEFDTINNYFRRMYCAWEVDRILDSAKSLGLYIDFNMMLHYQLMSPGPYHNTYFDWPNTFTECLRFDAAHDRGFCYGTDLGLSGPLDFLTDANAITFYKYRLRYMMARWGYARHVAMFQLVSEINSIGQGAAYEQQYDANGDPVCVAVSNPGSPYPYAQDHSVATHVNDWHREMLDYLKNELHVRQLLSVSYAGTPDGYDLTFFSPDLDIADYNNYPPFITDVVESYHNAVANGALGKPVMNSEVNGWGDGGSCTQVEMYRSEWSMPFSGQATGSIAWGRNPAYYPIIGQVKGFIANEDFNAGNWLSGYDRRNDNLAEVAYLYSTTEDRAMGAIFNRTYNGYVFSSCDPCGCHDNTHLPPPELRTPSDVEPTVLQELQLEHLNPVARYSVDWYDVLSGTWVSTDLEWTNALGKLTLEYPKLEVVNNMKPIVAFKVRRDHTFRLAQQNDTNLITTRALMFPNPADKWISIHVDTIVGLPAAIEVYSASGSLILIQSIISGTEEIDCSSWAEGSYLLYITGENRSYQTKITINHGD